ncbi:hypothetical protein ACNKHK_03065 [Shigella flexneri]
MKTTTAFSDDRSWTVVAGAALAGCHRCTPGQLARALWLCPASRLDLWPHRGGGQDGAIVQ